MPKRWALRCLRNRWPKRSRSLEGFRDALAVPRVGRARTQLLAGARPLARGASIVTLAGELTRIAEESARNSVELWQCWLRLRPARWNPEERKLLSEYVALLQIIAGGGRGEDAGAQGLSPLLQRVSEGGETAPVLGRDVAFGARAPAASSRPSSTWW